LSRQEVLGCLLRRQGAWTSGEEIAAGLGISRSAVWKQVQSLRSNGYEVEASPKKGYKLEKLPDILSAELVECGLETDFVGRSLFCYPETNSTNLIAKEMAPSAPNGAAVLAEVQTGSRGRMGRYWLSPPGGVWMSVILKPRIPLREAFRINLAASVAVARTIYGLYGLEAGIKWPNDLIVGEKKICGVLTEIGAEMDCLDYAVVGIGINANLDLDPVSFPEEWNATSISRELGRNVSRIRLVQRVLLEVERAYKEMTESFDSVHREWSDRSITLGRRVRIITRTGEFEGLATRLEDNGALRVRDDNGTETRVLAGDCVHLRPKAP